MKKIPITKIVLDRPLHLCYRLEAVDKQKVVLVKLILILLFILTPSLGLTLPVMGPQSGMTPQEDHCQWSLESHGTDIKLSINTESGEGDIESTFSRDDLLVVFHKNNNLRSEISAIDLGYDLSGPNKNKLMGGDKAFISHNRTKKSKTSQLVKVEGSPRCDSSDFSSFDLNCGTLFQKHIISFTYMNEKLISITVDVLEGGDVFATPFRWFYDIKALLGLNRLGSTTCSISL